MKHKAMKSRKTEQPAVQAASPKAYAFSRIEILDKRLGAGVGATRERKRLAKLLA